jgi:hypothetical protein
MWSVAFRRLILLAYIFDIDGTLTESVAVDEVCFVQAFRDVRAAKALV